MLEHARKHERARAEPDHLALEICRERSPAACDRNNAVTGSSERTPAGCLMGTETGGNLRPRGRFERHPFPRRFLYRFGAEQAFRFGPHSCDTYVRYQPRQGCKRVREIVSSPSGQAPSGIVGPRRTAENRRARRVGAGSALHPLRTFNSRQHAELNPSRGTSACRRASRSGASSRVSSWRRGIRCMESHAVLRL
jgi:hypothetical protein